MSRLPHKPIVYCISEGLADDSNFPQIKEDIIGKIRHAAACGVSMFQIREKNLSASKLFELSRAAALAARETGVVLLVNGRADIALAAGADGVHLPADGLPAAELRSSMPEGFIIGVSTHSTEEVTAAKAEEADFAVFGPVYASPGKSDVVGIEALAKICRQVEPFPVIALGGVNESNADEVLRHGASGFAAIRYLNDCLFRGVDVRN